MRNRLLLALAGVLAAATALPAQAPDVKEWPVEWGGRPRDPDVAPDGRVWFVGQQGNYIGVFDPKTEQFTRYEIEEGTHPHNLIVDENGMVWYAGNRNSRIGRLDPKTGEIQTFPTPGVRDPHTLVFDGKGNIWFTAQGASRVGRLPMSTGEIDIVDPYPGRQVNPYGIKMDAQGRPWIALFRTNLIAMIDPATLEVKRYATPRETARIRRLAITSDGMVWYVDFAGGYIGRLDPQTGQVREWQAPGGEGARPYGMAADDRDRLWFSEFGTANLVGFDPKAEKFFSTTKLSAGIRHMSFHGPTRTLWFGTDAGNIGRARVP